MRTNNDKPQVHGFSPFGPGGLWFPGNQWTEGGPPWNGWPGGTGMTPPAAGGGETQQQVNLWEHIGGLDGIITHMGKVQKILQMAQSMSPFMKLFTKSTHPTRPGWPGKQRESARRTSAPKKRRPRIR